MFFDEGSIDTRASTSRVEEGFGFEHARRVAVGLEDNTHFEFGTIRRLVNIFLGVL